MRNLKHFIIKGISCHTYMVWFINSIKLPKIHNITCNSVSIASIFNIIANKLVPKKPVLNAIFGKFGMVYGIWWCLCLLRKLRWHICLQYYFHIPSLETNSDFSKITSLLGWGWAVNFNGLNSRLEWYKGILSYYISNS